MVVQNPFEMGIQTVRLLLAMHDGDEADDRGDVSAGRAARRRHLHHRPAADRARCDDPLVKPADILRSPGRGVSCRCRSSGSGWRSTGCRVPEPWLPIGRNSPWPPRPRRRRRSSCAAASGPCWPRSWSPSCSRRSSTPTTPTGSEPLESLRDIARNTALLGHLRPRRRRGDHRRRHRPLRRLDDRASRRTVCASTMLALCAGARWWASSRWARRWSPPAVGASLLAGFLVGTLHTWLITAVRLPPFIATLATLVGPAELRPGPLPRARPRRSRPRKNSQINVYDPFFKSVRDNVWIPVARVRRCSRSSPG